MEVKGVAGADRLRSRSPLPKPVPAYLPLAGSPLTVPRDLYESVRRAPRILAEEFVIPIRAGKAWKASAGSIVRISTPEGPQVGDLNIWNAHNPRERFWASRTRQLHASHVTAHDRLWSCLPYMRPLVTIIADSLSWYGEDEHGGRVHDLLGTRRPLKVQVFRLEDERVLTDGGWKPAEPSKYRGGHGMHVPVGEHEALVENR